MKPVVFVFVALWLWPSSSSLLAYPTLTVSPAEEENLNHYVQDLQKLIQSVPTGDPAQEKGLASSVTADATGSPASPSSPSELTSEPAKTSSSELTSEPATALPSELTREPATALPSELTREPATASPSELTSEPATTSPSSPSELTSEPATTSPSSSSELISEPATTSPSSPSELISEPAKASEPSNPGADSAGLGLGSGAPPTRGRRKRTSTAFWSIKPNNVSVVLRADEPYIEKEEPEPEPEPPVTRRSPPARAPSRPSGRLTISTRSTHVDISTEAEDVPQLSGVADWEGYGESFERHPQSPSNSAILQKIADLSAQIQRGPVRDRDNPRYREFIESSRDHLKRSLALAAAAEHRLQKMYRSHVFSEAPPSHEIDDIETVINMLYNSRSKLPDYLDTKYIPSKMKERASTVVLILKKTLCLGQVETQSLIRKLLRNNMKILNLLDIT